MRCRDWPGCGVAAEWRVSVPADPWPLLYACSLHLIAAVMSLGGDCRVTVLLPGMDLPEPRPPAQRPTDPARSGD